MNSMNFPNTPPVTTQPQQVAHRSSYYTCNCDARVKKDTAIAGAIIGGGTTFGAGFAYGLNYLMSQIPVCAPSVGNPMSGPIVALIGGVTVCVPSTLAVAAVCICTDKCPCIQLHKRLIETVESVPLAGGQQQSLELVERLPENSAFLGDLVAKTTEN